MKKVLYRFLFFAIVFSSFSGCKKEETEDPKIIPAVGKITAEKIVAKSLEVVLLNTENIQFKNTSYQGTFNGQAVQINTYENKLIFVVPKLPMGNYAFQTTIEGVSFSTTYTIDSVASIVNADQFIAQRVPLYSFNDTLIDKIVNATKGMYDDFSNQANAAMFKQAREDFKAELANASPEAKADFASFVWANPGLFSPFEDVSTAIDSFNVARLSHGYGPEHEIEHFEQQLKARIFILGTTAILHLAFNAALLPFPVAKLFVSATTTGGLLAQIWLLNNWLIAKLDRSLLAFSAELFGVTRGSYEFYKDEPYKFTVKANYRNLNKDDMGSSSSLVKSIINELNSFETNWLKWMKLLPKSIVGSPYHIKNVTKSKVKKMNVNPDYLAIEIMNNPLVDVDIADADGFVGTFKTTAQTNQNFEFRVYYDFDQINNVYQTHQGALIVDKPDCSTLKASFTRNGKTITASATGGKAPYQYLFYNGYASQPLSSLNTFNLVYHGKYSVIVQDANGCRDTVNDCVGDAVINSVQTTADGQTGFPSGIMTLNYSSSLGLIPEFLIYNKNTNKFTFDYYLVTGGNSSQYTPADLTRFCLDGYATGVSGLTSIGSIGDANNRTLTFRLSNWNKPVGSSVVKMRFYASCNGVNICSGNDLIDFRWTPEYTLTW